MSKKTTLQISEETCVEIHNIEGKVFAPLGGFMDSADYKAVVENMHLDNGKVWPIPITLDVPEDRIKEIIKSEQILLIDGKNQNIAELTVEDVYKANYENDIRKVFGVDDIAHPGVHKEISRSIYRVGGPLRVFENNSYPVSEFTLSPEETKRIFKKKGWQRIAGFQTRNPIHRAHEYLQRVAMEVVDGVFIHPLIGWKKNGDFMPIAITKAYEKMIEEFYPKERVAFGTLETPMRYAGPREALFHAIIRRNFGCTHFIVGRDHAGVGNYYGKYEAHDLCRQFDNLGIEILTLCGPYYCRKCGGIVTEKTCPHGQKYALSISGTEVRKMFKNGVQPPEEYMRKEISEVLLNLQKEDKLFCEGVM